jgi:competence protein ComEC
VLPDGTVVRHLSGKREVEAFDGCAPGQIIVASVRMPSRDLPCDVFDPDRLRDLGALAVHADKDGLRLVSVRDLRGTRLWTSWGGGS